MKNAREFAIEIQRDLLQNTGITVSIPKDKNADTNFTKFFGITEDPLPTVTIPDSVNFKDFDIVEYIDVANAFWIYVYLEMKKLLP